MLFEDVIGAYVSARGAHRIEYRHSVSLNRLRPFFGGRDLRQLRRIDVRAYVAGRESAGVATSTVIRELRLLSAAINFCRLELDRQDLPNPVSRLGLREPEGRVRWITRPEAGRLIAAASDSTFQNLDGFIRLALNTGMRRGELLGLEWSRLDLDRCQVLLEARHNKSKKRQTVPLNNDALMALRRIAVRQNGDKWVFGEPCRRQVDQLKRSWPKVLKQADIQDFRVHDLRHTFASWLVMQGESLYVVKELLRHSSIRVTERYAHLAPEQTIAAVQRLLPF